MERHEAQRRHDQLLAKAESTTFPAEAEAFRAGAARLAAAHGLNEQAPHWTAGLGWQEQARHVDDMWRVEDGDIYDAVMRMFSDMDIYGGPTSATTTVSRPNGSVFTNVRIIWR